MLLRITTIRKSVYAFVHPCFAWIISLKTPQWPYNIFYMPCRLIRKSVLYDKIVNFILVECREFFMTIKVKNLTLRTPIETFQIHTYKGPHEENIVRLCRKKMMRYLLSSPLFLFLFWVRGEMGQLQITVFLFWQHRKYIDFGGSSWKYPLLILFFLRTHNLVDNVKILISAKLQLLSLV